ncbi:MAG TPA: hypothetical protein VHO72_00080 [Bacteroidales bacterium]|nr:hypothetical protein [Bacteroidales bacterium]
MKNKRLIHFFFKILPLIVSAVFHPLIMPTLGTYIILNSDVSVPLLDESSKNVVLTVVILCTFCLPLLFILLLNYKKLIQLNFLSEREDRIFPYIITGLLFYINFYLLRRMGVPFIIQLFSLTSVIAVIITLLVNMFWKISAHMTGIGGITAMVMILAQFFFVDVAVYMISAIVISGIIGFSRLSLNEHTPAQVYTGFLGGLVITYLSFLFLVI